MKKELKRFYSRNHKHWVNHGDCIGGELGLVSKYKIKKRGKKWKDQKEDLEQKT